MSGGVWGTGRFPTLSRRGHVGKHGVPHEREPRASVAHRPRSLISTVEAVRRPSTVELMLLTTIGLWALNLTVSRYILTHGFQPLAYATVRYGLAVLVFLALALAVERSLRFERRDLAIVAGAAMFVYVNQIAFVYALEKTSASVVGLILGATPIFAGLAGLALRTESLPPRFWGGALLSFAGVALVALGSGGTLSGDLGGVLLGVVTAATWAGYSIARHAAHAALLGDPDQRRRARRQRGFRSRSPARPRFEPGVEPGLGGLGAPRLRDARAARVDERAVVPLARPHRAGTGDAGREPPAVPRRGDRRRAALGDARPLELAGGVLIAGGILAARRRGVAPPPGE